MARPVRKAEAGGTKALSIQRDISRSKGELQLAKIQDRDATENETGEGVQTSAHSALATGNRAETHQISLYVMNMYRIEGTGNFVDQNIVKKAMK